MDAVVSKKQKKQKQKGEEADSRILDFAWNLLSCGVTKTVAYGVQFIKKPHRRGKKVIYTLVFKQLGGSLDLSVKFL